MEAEIKQRENVHDWNWDKINQEKCKDVGHVLMAPPHCEDGTTACYVCGGVWDTTTMKFLRNYKDL